MSDPHDAISQMLFIPLLYMIRDKLRKETFDPCHFQCFSLLESPLQHRGKEGLLKSRLQGEIRSKVTALWIFS